MRKIPLEFTTLRLAAVAVIETEKEFLSFSSKKEENTTTQERDLRCHGSCNATDSTSSKKEKKSIQLLTLIEIIVYNERTQQKKTN